MVRKEGSANRNGTAEYDTYLQRRRQMKESSLGSDSEQTSEKCLLKLDINNSKWEYWGMIAHSSLSPSRNLISI